MLLRTFIHGKKMHEKCVGLSKSPSQAPTLPDSSPAQAPTLPEQCRISKMCGYSLAQLIVSKILSMVKDFTCCKEIVQNTKYCWDKIMKILEDPNVPALAHLHPWEKNVWVNCVNITNIKIIPH
ncbi:hypothetical protein MKX01_026883 [Papaver californicum]|nr:hypothetical protein MKX01_026883 [Papaver californicum]